MYVKETGRKIKYIQPETVASTAADVVSDHQFSSHATAGDFCTIFCTTGTMYFLTDSFGTVLTTNKNGFEMAAGDTLDFVMGTSAPQTLSTGADGKFQLIVWLP